MKVGGFRPVARRKRLVNPAAAIEALERAEEVCGLGGMFTCFRGEAVE